MVHRVLVVGGSDADRERAQGALRPAGYETDLVANGAEAFEQLMALPYDLVIADCCMEKLDCAGMVHKVRGLGVRTPIMIWSATKDSAALECALKATSGSYVDKSRPVEELVREVGMVLNGGAHPVVKTPTPPPPTKVTSAKGGVLLIDGRAGEADTVRTLVPAGIHLVGCDSPNQGLAHAHNHKFDLVLFSADTSITNLTGTIAQLHLLLPAGFVVGVATPVRGTDPQMAVKALRDLDFDEVMLKPFKAAAVDRLVARYCSPWDELVVVSDDLVRASARTCARDEYKEFVATLRRRLEEGVRSLIDACFDKAVVDVSAVETLSPMDMGETLRRLKTVAAPFGLKVRFVAAPTAIPTLRKFEDSFGWEHLDLYTAIRDARAA